MSKKRNRDKNNSVETEKLDENLASADENANSVDESSQVQESPAEFESTELTQSDESKPTDDSADAEKTDTVEAESLEKPVIAVADKSTKSKQKRGFPFLGLLNLCLILGLIGVAFYYWQMQQKAETEKQNILSALQISLDKKADISQLQTQLQSRLKPLELGIKQSSQRLQQLDQQQAALLDSTKKLYDLYGRDENSWRLAEVEYLLRVAQHKLILENDFEGSALTLQAASDKIAVTADPGLLPVRVKINEEIATLKTRARPDLVGMTLLLSRLGQQIRVLKPGYQARIVESNTVVEEVASEEPVVEQAIDEKIVSFFSTLVRVRRNDGEIAPTTTEAITINIREIMEDNLKLTRWTVLERDDFQYRQLMKRNLELFEQYYDLDNAANNDFYSELQQLNKSEIKPQKPNINGSLELLRNIMTQRENAPAAVEEDGGDA